MFFRIISTTSIATVDPAVTAGIVVKHLGGTRIAGIKWVLGDPAWNSFRVDTTDETHYIVRVHRLHSWKIRVEAQSELPPKYYVLAQTDQASRLIEAGVTEPLPYKSFETIPPNRLVMCMLRFPAPDPDRAGKVVVLEACVQKSISDEKIEILIIRLHCIGSLVRASMFAPGKTITVKLGDIFPISPR